MWRLITPVIFFLLFYFGYSQKNSQGAANDPVSSFAKAEKIYKEANRIYDAAGEDALLLKKSDTLYLQALSIFSQLTQTSVANQPDSITLKAAFYAGLINHNFDSLETALGFYLRAIQIKERNTSLQDSIIFQPLLFSGSIYYKNGNYDSALYFYKQAESVKSKYTEVLEEEPRLYNVLGVIHYETGNLQQAINNIEKAYDLMRQSGSFDETLGTNYQLNLASAYIRVEGYEKAKQILEKLTGGTIYIDEVNQKLGFIALKEKSYKKAIQYYSAVKTTTGKKAIDLFINKCNAYRGLGLADSATYYLARAKTEYLRDKSNNSKILMGLILKAEAELAESRNKYLEAAEFYQQAIINFSTDFTDTSLNSNPSQFTGAFSYIDLFNTLTEKGDALENIFTTTKNTSHLEAALGSYQSAYRLSSYIEKTYNSDEARLFLNKLKYSNHHKPIDISLRIYELTQKNKFIEEAYYFDQLNKASALAAGIAESDIKTNSAKSAKLLTQISSLKTNITRLTLSSGNITDSTALSKMNTNIREQQIQLDKIQEDLKQQPEWKREFEKGQIPSIADLQKKLDAKSAILSYHLSEKEILAFVISRHKILYKRIVADSNFFAAVELYKESLHNINNGLRYKGKLIARYLFKQLIVPVQAILTQYDHLVIIPDDELHYLPFESLQDAQDHYLLEKFSVQYIYSTAFFYEKKKYKTSSGALAFAPFTQKGYKHEQDNFPDLKASYAEIENLKGLTLTDTTATKKRFLQEANHYPVIHLATHAVANNEQTKESFIVFSPADSNNKLFGSEIYNLNLDSTELIILSACETGSGKLIKGEGLMSLSRAFAYAGCRNIVTSLWRAEDVSTAFIMQQLHKYLAKGYSKARALQAAKIDLLKSNELNPVLKTPNYWAHIVFIGDYEERRSSSNWVWLATAIIIAGLVYLLFVFKKPR